MNNRPVDIDNARGVYAANRKAVALKVYGAVFGFVLISVISIIVLRIPIQRIGGMFGPLGRMVFQRLLPPNLGYLAEQTIVQAIFETFEMTCLGAFIGIAIAIPIAWAAAWNMTPNRYIFYPLGRAILALSRAVPTLIWAMLLVVILGFGPLAGVVALILETVGFAGKLFSEEIETIDMGPVEAIRATGANELQVFIYGVLGQVKKAWVGIIVYNWDSVFRASTVLGFVGAGGLGLYLRSTAQLMEYQKAMGIITLIIVLVLLSEITSSYLRQKVY